MREQRERSQNKMNWNKDGKPADQKRNESLHNEDWDTCTVTLWFKTQSNKTFEHKSCSTESPAVNK